ncbi:acetyltransferase [Parablautia muri]|uniref:Acetyltransferase n=1 Tax=Parablautia muri TaxID=2320879 RepID=A0A9X5BEW6_9FIRM|nr:acetyltransferase [Parablautia muri]NBJ92523.1 acetyltransferase [Parablautia muri]
MRKLVLIGGGGHCKSVIDTVKRLHLYDEVVVTDPHFPSCREILDIRIVGGDEMLSKLKNAGFHEAFITVGSIKNTQLRESLHRKACDLGFIIPNIIDPSACVSEYTVMEKGIFIGKNAIVNADARIHEMAIINTGAIIEHECVIGKYSHIAVGAVLCGGVSIGNHSLVGAGTTIIQGIKVGSHSLIGAGSTVLCDVENKQLVKGLVK